MNILFLQSALTLRTFSISLTMIESSVRQSTLSGVFRCFSRVPGNHLYVINVITTRDSIMFADAAHFLRYR